MELRNLLESENINPVRVKLQSTDENYFKISWDFDQGSESIWTEITVDKTKTVLFGSIKSYSIPREFHTGELKTRMIPMFNDYFKYRS